MGKKSLKTDKNIFQLSREAADLTRAAAAEKLDFISESRIARIESDEFPAQPDEVLAMSKAYNDASLCNMYCSRECAIGKKFVPELTVKDLSQITVEILSSLAAMQKEKDRLVDIVVDGKISEDEEKDFAQISDNLDKMSIAIDSLKLWTKQTMGDK